MEDEDRARIGAILTHHDGQARHEAGVRLARNAAAIAKSGGAGGNRHWFSEIEIVEDQIASFLEKSASDANVVSHQVEAFSMIAESFEALRRHLFQEFRARFEAASRQRAMAAAEVKLPQALHDAEARLRAKLEHARAMYAVAAANPAALTDNDDAASYPIRRKGRGGKPLAAHWDDMWAHIAVQLWNGDLKPKSQADITKAMFAWFNDKEIDIGPTAVTDRARALWLKIEATQ